MGYKTKEQNREYQRLWREKNRDKQRERNKLNRIKNREFVSTLKNGPCADCGVSYPPYVMDFDHLDDKVAGVAELVIQGYGKTRIMQEIAKCELVCANCHRIRTFRRLAQQKSGTLI